MERSTSQKILIILSVLNLLIALAYIVISGLGIYAIRAGLVSTEVPHLGLGVAILIMQGVIHAAQGVCGFRASGNNTLVNPLWVVAGLGVMLAIPDFVISFVQGTFLRDLPSDALALLFSVALFFLANQIKIEAEEDPQDWYDEDDE